MVSNGINAITLRITGPDGWTQESVSELESIILGSGAGAGIQIPDPKVSNLHVMLKVEKGGRVQVIDLGSEGGTRIGERPVQGPTQLNPGDIIRVGASRVEVLFGTVRGRVNPGSPGETAVPTARVSAATHGVPPHLVPRRTALGPPSVMALNSLPKSSPKSSPRIETLPLDAAATGESVPKPGERILQVAQVWGDTVVGLQHFGSRKPVTVGDATKNDFHVFSPSVGKHFKLAEARGEQALIRVPGDAQLTLMVGARRVGPELLRAEGRLRPCQGGEEIRIRTTERVKISINTQCFFIRFVAAVPHPPMKRLKGNDFVFVMLSALLWLATGCLLAVLMKIPRPERISFAEMADQRATLVKLLIKSPKAAPLPKPNPKKEEKAKADEGAKAKADEGAMGKPSAKQAEADPSKPGSPVVDHHKKEKDRTRVMGLGLLAALQGQGGGASNVFGPGGLGSGLNEKLGGLKGGAGLTDRQGVGGAGSRGSGPGGGGTGLVLGGLGVQGQGPGGPGGHGGLELNGRGHDTTRILPGKTVVVGGLSKEVIAKVIRDHQREIKYCYESALNKFPELAGKVAVQFLIGADGTVQDAAVNETSLNNSEAENCMLTRIRRWKFPEPEGGGVVSVGFPWIFKPAGSAGNE